MKVINFKFMLKMFSLAVIFLTVGLVSPAAAQQANPNNLPPCPNPDVSKTTDLERFAKWSNCWGRYKVELDNARKGEVLEGEWLNGKQHGQGIYTYANGFKYVGDFKYGNPNGKGAMTYPDGSTYIGEWRNGKINGQGTYADVNGDKYVGDWKDNKKHGRGTFTSASGNQYVGEWKENNNHGQGIGILADGKRFEGVWENGKLARECKVNIPSQKNGVVPNSDKTSFDCDRQKLADEQRQFEEDKRQREQAKSTVLFACLDGYSAGRDLSLAEVLIQHLIDDCFQCYAALIQKSNIASVCTDSGVPMNNKSMAKWQQVGKRGAITYYLYKSSENATMGIMSR